LLVGQPLACEFEDLYFPISQSRGSRCDSIAATRGGPDFVWVSGQNAQSATRMNRPDLQERFNSG